MSDDVVRAALEALRGKLPPEKYDVWAKQLELVRIGESHFHVLAKNRFVADWLQRDVDLLPALVEALLAAGVAEPRIDFVSNTPRSAQAKRRSDHAELPAVDPGLEANAIAGPPDTDSTSINGTEPGEIAPSVRTTYTEGNFARLPFAVVCDKDIRKVDEICLDITVRTPQGMDRKLWRVTAGKSGMPGPFDHAVFRALEKLALDSTVRRKKQLKGPVYFHIKTIIELLQLHYNSRNVYYVSTAFDRLQELSIEDASCFSRKNDGTSRKGKRNKIGLLDWVKAAGAVARVSSGIAIAGTYAVKFSDDYENSVNSGFIRPLDWEFWLKLNRPIARRLMEILEPDFYGLVNGPHVAYGLEEICPLIPIRTKRWLSDTMLVLDRGHKELADGGFLTWKWDLTEKKFPRVLYNPGERWQSFHRLLGHRIEITDEAIKLAQELGEPTRAAFYQKIINQVDRGYLNEALQDLRAKILAGSRPEKPAAWFVGTLKKILAARGLTLGHA